MAPGAGIYELYGTNLAGDPALFSVTVNGQSAEPLYVSSTQVNFRVPAGIAGSVNVAVANGRGSDQATLEIPE